MSRNCYDCSEDDSCILQKNGVYACSNGSFKSKDRRIRDLNDEIIDIIDRLEYMMVDYTALGNPKKVKSLKRITGTMKEEYNENIADRNRRLQLRRNKE